MNFYDAKMYTDYSIPCTENASCSWKNFRKCVKIPLKPLISLRDDSIIVLREKKKLHGIEYYMYRIGERNSRLFYCKNFPRRFIIMRLWSMRLCT